MHSSVISQHLDSMTATLKATERRLLIQKASLFRRVSYSNFAPFVNLLLTRDNLDYVLSQRIQKPQTRAISSVVIKTPNFDCTLASSKTNQFPGSVSNGYTDLAKSTTSTIASPTLQESLQKSSDINNEFIVPTYSTVLTTSNWTVPSTIASIIDPTSSRSVDAVSNNGGAIARSRNKLTNSQRDRRRCHSGSMRLVDQMVGQIWAYRRDVDVNREFIAILKGWCA
ncbi:unnamed protein product [Protopolystoma xenopodis]|uniref:Uncharacterized protein n=1 Tax=Protopolystoma xenopodis TaxID=117903 RepID=A0A3S5CMN5_9PLAT|nr:unnamed protein product [Protopolystoma xenopodis]